MLGWALTRPAAIEQERTMVMVGTLCPSEPEAPAHTAVLATAA